MNSPAEIPGPVQLPSGSLGAPGPAILQQISKNGRWAVLCQARADTDGDGSIRVEYGQRGELRGDRLTPYLVRGSGLGEPIQELVHADPTSRWLVFLRAGQLVLFDDYTGHEVNLSELGADAREDSHPELPHRALSFDAEGEHLAYLRLSTGGQPRPGQPRLREAIVLRTLASGEEKVYPVESGSVYRLRLSPDGNWLIVYQLVDDSNGNQRLDWPTPVVEPPRPEAPGGRRCLPPTSSYAVYPNRGDQVFIRTAYLGLGEKPFAAPAGARKIPAKRRTEPPGAPHKLSLRPTDNLVTPFGDALILREASGRLVLKHPKYQEAFELSSDSCAAKLIHSDLPNTQLIVACAPDQTDPSAPKGRHGLRALQIPPSPFHPRPAPSVEMRALELFLAPIHSDTWASPTTTPLIEFYPGAETKIYNVETKTLHALNVGDIVIQTHERSALIRRRNQLWLFQEPLAGNSPWQPLGLEVDEVASQLSQGRYLWLSPHWLDLARAPAEAHLGALEHVLALSDDGRALIPAETELHASGLPLAPFSWVSAQAPASPPKSAAARAGTPEP